MAYYLLDAANSGGIANGPAAAQALKKAHALSKNVTEKERLQIEAVYADAIEGNKDRYFALVKEFAAKYPKEKEAHAWLGSLYMYMVKDPEKALKEYDLALSLDPNFGQALNLLGYLYMGRREFTKAQEYLQRQVIATPENPNAYDALAECYFSAGKIEEAKATLLKLTEMPPSQTRFDLLLYINTLEENYGETLRLSDKAIEVAPAEEKAFRYYLRGFYRAWLGDLRGSLSDLKFAEEIARAMGRTRTGMVTSSMRLRSWIYLDQHELDLSRKSVAEYRAYALRERQEYATLYDAYYDELLGQIECEERKADSAELRLKEMEALIPKVEARNSATSQEALKYQAGLLRAEVMLARGRVDEVIGFLTTKVPRPQAYSSELSLTSYNVPFLKDVLARAYVKKGAVDKAIAEYERLTTFDFRNEAPFLIHPKYHYRLGLLYEQKGQKVKATERYRKFLDLWKAADPKLPEVADATQRLAALS